MLAVTFAGIVSAHAQGPAFRVDPYWPKPLPNNWILGQVGGISIDAQDNIWVFQRPRSLTDDEKGATLSPPRSKCCMPAPSVLVFNQSGDIVKSWGGQGENLGYDWPLQEHGILVDNKGFVWLSGNGKGDNMVLKFSTDGKFVKQIGKSGPLTSSTDTSQFGMVAALEIDARANEIYAADGYGNHRVAVLDGDSGEIKRIWGAYGKPPTDEKVAWDPKGPPPQQFGNPVHCITITNDGLVLVCDRSHNRMQMFRKDGTFVREISVLKDSAPGTIGSIAKWPDAAQTYLIVVDDPNGQFHVIDRASGNLISSFGRVGHQLGEFYNLHNIGIDSKGNIYTAEVQGKRVQKFRNLGGL
jgi:DNA-binding beta-propeller fold protein YncE